MNRKPRIRTTGKRIVVTEVIAKSLGLAVHLAGAEVSTDSLWFEMTLADSQAWTVALRLVKQRGRLVISECRIFPNETTKLDAGEWSASVLGDAAIVPLGGLTTRLVRSIRLGEIARHIPAILTEAAKQKTQPRDPKGIGDMLDRVELKTGFRSEVATRPRPGEKEEDFHYFGLKGTFGERGIRSPNIPIKAGAKRGPRPMDNTIYLRIVDYYLRKVKAGSSHPTLDVVNKFRFSRSKAQGMLEEAERRGLWERANWGSRGGQLTPLGERLLADQTLSNIAPRTRQKRMVRRKAK